MNRSVAMWGAAGVLALGLVFTGATASAVPDGWHGNLKDGLEAAAKSGKPVLAVTLWGPGI